MTASAISSGLFNSHSGTTDNIAASAAGWAAMNRASVGVRTYPGATAFTRIPCVAYCRAADLVRPVTPCLDATFATAPGAPMRPVTEPLFTMAPFPRFNISGISYFMQSHIPVRFRCHDVGPILFGRLHDAHSWTH